VATSPRRRARQRLATHADAALLDPLLRIAMAVLAQAAQDTASAHPELRDPARAWLDAEGQTWIEILAGEGNR
jgi:uncharacterized protein YfaQ (DUF2300 family)